MAHWNSAACTLRLFRGLRRLASVGVRFLLFTPISRERSRPVLYCLATRWHIFSDRFSVDDDPNLPEIDTSLIKTGQRLTILRIYNHEYVEKHHKMNPRWNTLLLEQNSVEKSCRLGRQ